MPEQAKPSQSSPTWDLESRRFVLEARWVTDSKPTAATRCSESYYGGEQGRLCEQKRGATDSGIEAGKPYPRLRGEEEERIFEVEPNVREHSMLKR